MAIIGDTKTTLSVPMNMSEEMLAFARRQSDAYSMFGIEDYGSLAPHVQNFTLTAFLPSSPRRYNREIINESSG